MRVNIEMIPRMNTSIEFATSLKNIVKDLIQTCRDYEVTELTYTHDYFKIHINQSIISVIPKDYKDIINYTKVE